MERGAETWHYGLIAKWWAEFNDDFRTHEIPYFQRHIEHDGEPALDVACGTGRLLIPYLRAGLDVDGCDVSADMMTSFRDEADHTRRVAERHQSSACRDRIAHGLAQHLDGQAEVLRLRPTSRSLIHG